MKIIGISSVNKKRKGPLYRTAQPSCPCCGQALGDWKGAGRIEPFRVAKVTILCFTGKSLLKIIFVHFFLPKFLLTQRGAMIMPAKR